MRNKKLFNHLSWIGYIPARLFETKIDDLLPRCLFVFHNFGVAYQTFGPHCVKLGVILRNAARGRNDRQAEIGRIRQGNRTPVLAAIGEFMIY